MLFARLVVEQCLTLQRVLDCLAGKLAVFGGRGRKLQDVEGGAGVAVGVSRYLPQQVKRRTDLHHRQSPLEQTENLLLGQRLQHVNLGARKQRRNYLERRVFRRGADQADVAALHVGKKSILLRFIEAVNLVDEDERTPSDAAVSFRIGHHSFYFFDPAQYGAEWNVVAMRQASDNSGQRGLANPGRPPKDDRTQLIPFDLHAQRLTGP